MRDVITLRIRCSSPSGRGVEDVVENENDVLGGRHPFEDDEHREAHALVHRHHLAGSVDASSENANGSGNPGLMILAQVLDLR
jgi:hypothetical protein